MNNINKLSKSPLAAWQTLRDPVSGLTHLAGAVLAVVGMLVLLFASNNSQQVVAAAIYGSSLILLYLASSLYHLLPVSPAVLSRLRLFDHLMIYVLIAGTYTPICLLALSGKWGIGLLIAIWVLAVIGMALQGIWFKVPRWLSTSIYILMGWMVVVAFIPLYRAVPLPAVIWLIVGGLFYTIGATIYALKKPNFGSRWFGFHEVFHLFVLAGSLSHYWMIARYVLPH